MCAGWRFNTVLGLQQVGWFTGEQALLVITPSPSRRATTATNRQKTADHLPPTTEAFTFNNYSTSLVLLIHWRALLTSTNPRIRGLLKTRQMISTANQLGCSWS